MQIQSITTLVLLVRIQDLGVLVYRSIRIPPSREQSPDERYLLLHPHRGGTGDAEHKVWNGRQRRQGAGTSSKRSMFRETDRPRTMTVSKCQMVPP